MKLYFGNGITIVTTLLLLGLIIYMILLIKNRENIISWGRRTLLLCAWGLIICCTAATRDGLHLTIQNAIDRSTAPGLFPIVSIPTVIGTVGAALIILAGIFSIFAHKQNTRRILCFICMSGIVLKIAVIELFRFIG